MISWSKRIGIVTGNTFEYYDIAVFAAISTYIAVNFFPGDTKNSLLFVWGIFALRFLMRPVGGYIMGWYADKYGRKPALILTSGLIGIATITLALLPTYNEIGLLAPCILLLLQMIQSFCFGGEYPVIISYLVDNSTEKEKSRVSALIVASSLMGVVLSLVITFGLEYSLTKEQMTAWGWRIPLFLGIFNIIFSFYFKLKLTDKLSTMADSQGFGFDLNSIIKVFLVTIPAGITFYVNAVSSSTVINAFTDDSATKTLFALLSNALLVVLFLIAGWLIDKYSNAEKAMTAGIYSLILFSAPLYMLLDSSNIIVLGMAKLCILGISAIILAPTCAVIFEQTAAKNRTTSLALGYNLALSIFGGLTPLAIAALSSYDTVYTGLVLGATGFTYVFAIKLMNTHFDGRVKTSENVVLS
ncbi:MFS transporter [Spartinivicinus poritis]|uniref:MFS transporter n=1 Tax=Spartinivicinus poritis TaxID=2994640 RepID=A0ABT5UKG4_9GAMM|nr:MFS transporter [Spartinivicinus sp. A2-2]MDE1465524.1 MFS transporter [Spartinivicinus sp. A2-2]